MRYLVIKVGGSLVSPRDTIVDEKFVREFVNNIKSIYSNPENSELKMVIVVGGGNISRNYRDISVSLGEMDDIDQHRIGIVATWMNAELVRILLDSEGLVYKRTLGIGVFANSLEIGIQGITEDFNSWKNGDKPILVSGGFVNGASTDLNAFVLASKLEIDKVFKMSNIDYVYSEDPDDNPNAKPFPDLTWDKYLGMFEENGHKPGQNVPVDLLGARLARDNKISLCLMDGRDPSVIKNIVEEKKFDCTNIH
ncbi:MAG: hypothetical protein ABIC57_00100 [bacterium]